MILIKPLMTEKAVRMIELENKIAFIVARNSNKTEIKKEFESLFNTKIDSINVHIIKNKKIAFIRLKEANTAANVATKMGVM